jgi:hypothetical protein
MTIAERMKRSKGVGTGQNEESGAQKAALLIQSKRIPRDVILIGIAVLVATGSFGLGVVAGREGGAGEREGKVLIEKPEAIEAASAAVGAAPKLNSEKKGNATAKSTSPSAASGGQYVASKTGTKYYLPWCGSVKRIKDENKVWFASKTEAEAAGYEPAKNCKGL